ncbi:MAG TPA: hypothetical protein VNV37_11395 [Solirubrobacteraceae bacterium]|jgi:hypothetical protein|nr:hypothetical protein [Solirubrobacteraceae bacterium]
MTAQDADRPTVRLAAVARTAWARLRHGGGRAALALLLAAGLGAWLGDTPAGASVFAQPLQVIPGVGSMQSTVVGTPFPIPLAVTVSDAHEKPVAGALVTFSAPVAGASGRFTVHARGRHHRVSIVHTETVMVRTDARGIAVAPAFIANDTPGGYIVMATVKRARPAAFALVNEAT